MSDGMKVGIVGAGIAGLACAEGLAAAGHDVMLIDKGRGPGGRMSTRRIPIPAGEAQFDHGAQYFTARDPRFAAQVRAWIDGGAAAAWPAAGEAAYVGVPGMNAPVRRLAARHTVHWATRVVGMEPRERGWRLTVEPGDDLDVDLAVLAVPAEQAAELLAGPAPRLAARAAAAVSDPCWAVLAAFAEPVAAVADCHHGADGGALGWAARNSAKPGRTGPESWVLQGSPGWSLDHLADDPNEVTAALLAAAKDMLGAVLPRPLATAAHLWRYARCAPDGTGPVFDAERRLGLCGDWVLGPRVESAWLSGVDLAEALGMGMAVARPVE